MRVSSSADDLNGRTALLLLTQLSSARRVLFMLSAVDGFVTVTSEPGLRAVRFSPHAIPFTNGAFDAVVLDIDTNGLRQPARTRALEEVHRVLKPGGQCLIAASNRHIPRDRRNWRQYHLVRPDRRWSTLASGLGFTISNRFFARLDRARIVELISPSGGRSDFEHATATDRQIMVLCRSGDSEGQSFLQRLIPELQASLDCPQHSIRLDRFLIRRIGKTTLVVACDDERRYVVRVARSPMASNRAHTNFAALKALHSTHLISDEMKAMVPRPERAGDIDKYPYYVEASLPGTARDDFDGWPSGTGWEPGALAFISDMHFATKRPVRIDRQVFDQFFAAPLDRIRRRCATPKTKPVLDRLGVILERAVAGETIPFVWSHGDFSAGNCLYDGTRRLTGVVDWELFSDYQLPLLDVLNSMEIPEERNSHETWQRFDAIRELARQDRALQIPALASYVERIGVPKRVLPALMVMYWVDHLAKRIDGRANDAVWMTKRVLQPLSSLASIELT